MLGKIVGYEPPRRLTLTLTGPVEILVDYVLDDLGGRTRLTQRSEMRFKNRLIKIVGALMQPLLKGAAAKQAESSFGKLKRLVEAG